MEKSLKLARVHRADLVLPAYSHLMKLGHLFKFTLEFVPGKNNIFTAEGALGEALNTELIRVLNILYSIDAVWKVLTGKFYLKGCYPQYTAGDTTSAGLGLAITLFNIIRSINGSRQVKDIVGTGFIRIGGGIDLVEGINSKSAAVLRHHDSHCQLLTAKEVSHLRLLDRCLIKG